MTNFTINTSKQLAAAHKSIDLSDNVRKTFKALALMCDFSNNTHTCYPKYSTLAKKAGFHRTTVIKHVEELIKLGVLSKQDSYYICPRTNQRRQTSNLYTFNIDAILALTGKWYEKVKSKVRIVHQRLTKKTRLSSTTAKQLNQKQLKKNRSTCDQVSVIDEKKGLKALATQLTKANVFNSWKEGFEGRKRSYFCNADGGIYKTKASVSDIKQLVGYVKYSQAHQAAWETIKFISARLREIE